MPYKFLFVTLFISSSLIGMQPQTPKPQQMFYGSKTEEAKFAKIALLNKVPSVVTMDEYAALPNTRWVYDSTSLDEYKAELTAEPYFQFLCIDSREKTEAIEELITETNERTSGHLCNCARACSVPCSLVAATSYYIYSKVRADQQDDNCWTQWAIGITMIKATKNSLLARWKLLRGISDSTQKTWAARQTFMGLRTADEAHDPESKKNK